MKEVFGTTKVCCLIGDPVAHSLSPPMHNAAFQQLNLDYVYVVFRVAANKLKQAVEGIKALNIIGVNVTIPHKVSVIEYLDELDDMARNIGAVNTIVNRDGTLIGYNTDGLGAMRVLNEFKVNINGSKFVVIGAGGVARAISFYLVQLGANVVILNRTKSKAERLAEDIKRKVNREVKALELNSKNLEGEIENADVIINCTSVGMHPNEEESIVPIDVIREDLVVFDTVYNPYKTKLLRDAESKGAKCISGVKMLVYQGAEAFKLWTGKEPPLKIMEETVLKYLK
ncbi:MAG: shikimate dehydrogenase [Candidatus Odinarchaeia archaeon]